MWIEPDRTHTCRARAGNVRSPGISDHHRLCRVHGQTLESLTEDCRVRFCDARFFGDHDRVQVSIESAEAQLVVLLTCQVVGHDADAYLRLQGVQQRRRTTHFPPGLHVAGTVRHGGPPREQPVFEVRGGDADRFEQATETLLPRVVQRHLFCEDAKVQRLEDFGVAPIEVRGVDERDSRVTLTDGLQRLSRGVSMVEERVVEIEEDRSNQRAAL